MYTVHPSLEFREGVAGLGGFAKETIPAGTHLIAIPYGRILSEPYAESTLHGTTAISCLRAANPVEVSGRTVLYLVMMAEYAGSPGVGSGAPFHDYLTCLPERYDDPLWWPPEMSSALLAGTNLHQAVMHRLKWLQRIYDVCFPALSLAHPTLFPQRQFTFSRFMWVHSAFSSRGFPHILSVPPLLSAPSITMPPREIGKGESGPKVDENEEDEDEDVNPLSGRAVTGPIGCMLPIVDILNHGPRTAITWMRGAEGVTLVSGTHQGGGEEFVGAPIPAGAEVLNNYGPKSNEELLLAFGFVIPGNMDDIHVLRLKLGSHKGIARKAGIPERHVCGGADGMLPSSLLSAARLLVLFDHHLPSNPSFSSSASSSSISLGVDAPLPYLLEEQALHALAALFQMKLDSLRRHHPWVEDPGPTLKQLILPPFKEGDGVFLSNASKCPPPPTSLGQHPPIALACPADGDFNFPPTTTHPTTAHREWMARVYVEGQWRVLATCLKKIGCMLGELWGGGGAATRTHLFCTHHPPSGGARRSAVN